MTPAPSLRLSGAVRIGGAHVFDPLLLEAEAGRWTCLLGPSGAGKSTILRLLAGLGDDVALDGEITAGDRLPLAGRVALMAQSDLLMPWHDLRENVLLGARLRGTAPDSGRALSLLDRVGLSRHVYKRPAEPSGGSGSAQRSLAR